MCIRDRINEAHAMGLSVLLDLVHSHAVKNTAEGINGFDGRDDQFFKSGAAGDHPAWGSKVFDYGKNGVVPVSYTHLNRSCTQRRDYGDDDSARYGHEARRNRDRHRGNRQP